MNCIILFEAASDLILMQLFRLPKIGQTWIRIFSPTELDGLGLKPQDKSLFYSRYKYSLYLV